MIDKARDPIPLLAPGTPWTVKAAVLLFTLSWLYQVHSSLPLLSYAFRQGLYASHLQRLGSILVIAGLGCWFALNAALIFGLVYQKNWARISQMLLTLVGLLLLALFVTYSATANVGSLYIVGATAAVLLFLPSSTAWFNQPRQQSGVADSGQ